MQDSGIIVISQLESIIEDNQSENPQTEEAHV
jgi:hypothetical protein